MDGGSVIVPDHDVAHIRRRTLLALPEEGRAVVQNTDVGGVQVRLEPLHEVHVPDLAERVGMRLRQSHEFIVGELRLFVGRAEVDPHQAPAHPGRIDRRAQLPRHRRLRQVRHVQDIAVDVEFPAVEDAPQPVAFAARQGQRDAAVHAVFLEQPELALAVAPQQEVLAHHPHANRGRVGLGGLMLQEHRHPEPPQQVAHRRARTDPRQIVVLFFVHRAPLLACGSRGLRRRTRNAIRVSYQNTEIVDRRSVAAAPGRSVSGRRRRRSRAGAASNGECLLGTPIG
jgi:hypothetical protein